MQDGRGKFDGVNWSATLGLGDGWSCNDALQIVRKLKEARHVT